MVALKSIENFRFCCSFNNANYINYDIVDNGKAVNFNLKLIMEYIMTAVQLQSRNSATLQTSCAVRSLPGQKHESSACKQDEKDITLVTESLIKLSNHSQPHVTRSLTLCGYNDKYKTGQVVRNNDFAIILLSM